jgi:hypothetical protein
MAQEQRRGCGYRKVGGLYLCGGALGTSCCRLPISLHVCPTCNAGVKQTRGWQWIDPRPWLTGGCVHAEPTCPAANPERLGDRVGLLWIGAQFYPTPADFTAEVMVMGVSRRITAVPRGLELSKTWVFLAHPRIKEITDPSTGKTRSIGGVFRIFKPERIEKIITASQACDAASMAKLAEAGITPVVVPDDDRDHRGTIYDKPGADSQFEMVATP